MLRQLKLHRPFATGRAVVLLLAWFTLTSVVFGAIIVVDLSRVRSQFNSTGEDLMRHVSDRALVSETAIEGFAAFVGSLDGFDEHRVRQYARTLLARYRFLFRFEIAQRVAGADRASFVTSMASRHPGFQIKRFTYRSGRTWEAVAPADFYYPLIFQEPELAGSARLIGLDIAASDFLRAAMRASFKRGEPVATRLFELAQGGKGYVLHRSVEHLGRAVPSAFAADQFVLLVLRAEDLFAGLDAVPQVIAARALQSGGNGGDEVASDEMLLSKGRSASAMESWLLPRFQREFPLDLGSRAFVMRIAQQLGWRDLNLMLMVIVALGSLVIFFGLREYAQQYIDRKLLTLDQEGKLYELANYDSLTGMANRNRLMDYVENTLARARRNHHHFAVLFLDLDGFKAINDEYGHSLGDLILVDVARRLTRHLREDELIARFGGDEFVWVTGGSEQAPAIDELIVRLKAEFVRPCVVKRLKLHVGLSVGYAVYPRDGKNIAALFDIADEAMYRDKKRATELAHPLADSD